MRFDLRPFGWFTLILACGTAVGRMVGEGVLSVVATAAVVVVIVSLALVVRTVRREHRFNQRAEFVPTVWGGAGPDDAPLSPSGDAELAMELRLVRGGDL